MKKMLTLLALISIISGAAYAEKKLEMTYVDQEIEYEHENKGRSDDITFETGVGLKYDTWTFRVAGAKFWLYNTSTKGETQKKGFNSSAGKVDLSAWNKVTPDLKLGTRYIGHSDYDRFYLRYSYGKGHFWSSGDISYRADKGPNNDKILLAVYPLGAKYKDIKAAWRVSGTKYRDPERNKTKMVYEHQLRVWAPIYSTEKLTLDTQLRFVLAGGRKFNGETQAYRVKTLGNTMIYLNLGYNITENLNLYSYVGYEIKHYKYKNYKNNEAIDKAKRGVGGKSYVDIGIGWNYTL